MSELEECHQTFQSTGQEPEEPASVEGCELHEHEVEPKEKCR